MKHFWNHCAMWVGFAKGVLVLVNAHRGVAAVLVPDPIHSLLMTVSSEVSSRKLLWPLFPSARRPCMHNTSRCRGRAAHVGIRRNESTFSRLRLNFMQKSFHPTSQKKPKKPKKNNKRKKGKHWPNCQTYFHCLYVWVSYYVAKRRSLLVFQRTAQFTACLESESVTADVWLPVLLSNVSNNTHKTQAAKSARFKVASVSFSRRVLGQDASPTVELFGADWKPRLHRHQCERGVHE